MKRLLLMSLAALMLASCNDDDDNNDNGRIPISLSSQLTAEPQRLDRQNNQIASGQQVSFFVTESGVPSQIAYNNARLTADGNGRFTIFYNNVDNAVLYYPLYAAGSDFYAIHPYGNITLGGNYNFNILADQTSIGNFLNSDLLYSKRGPVMPVRNPVQLLFEHKLAKINFVVIAGDGTDLTGLQRVEIIGTQPQAVLNTLTGATSTGTATPAINVTAYGLVDGYANVEPGQVSNISAIIVPQTFAANQALFRITINGISFTYTPASEVVFAGGISYTYRLTLDNANIEVTSEIKPWTVADDEEGTGIIE